MRQPVANRALTRSPETAGARGSSGNPWHGARPLGKLWPMLAGGLACLGAARAVDASKWLVYSMGPLRLKPQLGVTEQFDDNIFYANKANARADLISSFSPGFVLDIGRRENPLSAKLDYNFDEYVYARTDLLNHQDHRLAFSARFEKSRLSIQGADTFEVLSGPINFSRAAEDITAISILGRKVERISWTDRYHVNYLLTEKTFLGAGFNHNRMDYESGVNIYDYDSTRGSLDFGYQASEKIAVFGQTYLGVTSAKPNNGIAGPAPDLDFMGVFLGVRGQFTPKLSGSVQAGYESRAFDDGSPSQGSPVVELDLDYAMTSRRVLSLSYSRTSNISVEASSYSYITDLVGLSCVQALGTREKLSVRAGAYVRFSEYDQVAGGAKRSDQYYIFSAAVNYKFDVWLTGSLGYDYERLQTSSAGIVDYGVNRVTLKLTLGY